MKFRAIIILLIGCNLLLLLLGLTLGSGNISVNDVLNNLWISKTDNSIAYVIQEVRLPRSIMALLAGSALACAGLLMQTLFSNPLAGPYILGVSSGASLGVALVTLSTISVFAISLPIAAFTGALASALIIVMASKWVKQSILLLIIGVMLASFVSAITGILSYFSTADDLKTFVIWSLGDFGKVNGTQLALCCSLLLTGIIATFLCIKPLNALLAGERYMKSNGYNMSKVRLILIVITAWLTGIVTAYCGPIAFIGLAVPNVVRFMVNSSNHRVMLPLVALLGGIIGLFCDIFARLPGYDFNLPINAVTALIGAPVVVLVLLKDRKIKQ